IGAAISGGFTGVVLMPSTSPAISNKSQVEYIKQKAAGALVDIFPAGSLSHKLEGEELSEMYDMHIAGAVAFTDDKKSITDAGLMMRALLYVKNFNSRILTHPNDKSVASKGMMNEGVQSTLLGIKGIP